MVTLLHAVQRRLVDADLGVVGCERIGTAFAHRMAPSVQELLVFDPRVDSVPAGAERVDCLDGLLSRGDLVSLHLPLTPGTHHLIGRPSA